VKSSGRRGTHEHDFPALESRREQARGPVERPYRRTAESRDELASPHSITSSARNRRASGIVRPIALAVLRLITNAKFVGCSIGKSAGAAPRSTLSTRPATSRYARTMRGPYPSNPPSWALSGHSKIDGSRSRRSHRRTGGLLGVHSITSSARTRIVSGMVMPRAFAVLRLTISSNRDGRSIGRSAGLVPPRMRPT
jgi:hypothetical protein